MAKHRKFLPLLPMVEQTVKDKEGLDTRVLHFPISVILQRLLLSQHHSRLLTGTQQAHVLTTAEAAANALGGPHLTALPTQPADGRMRGPVHGQSSRRSPFMAPEHVLAANKDPVYIGDLVEVRPMQAQEQLAFARVRAMFWSDAQQQLLISISDLLRVSEHSQLRRSKPPPAPPRDTVAMYENTDRDSERDVTADHILRHIWSMDDNEDYPAVVGYVRFVRDEAYMEEQLSNSSHTNSSSTGSSRTGNSTAGSSSSSSSNKRPAAHARREMQHVPLVQAPRLFNLRADDVYHPVEGQPTATIGLCIHTDKFSATQMAYSNTPLCATYWQPLIMDSTELRKRCNMFVGGFGAPQLDWQTDTHIHVQDILQLERGVRADVRLPDGRVLEVRAHDVVVAYTTQGVAQGAPCLLPIELAKGCACPKEYERSKVCMQQCLPRCNNNLWCSCMRLCICTRPLLSLVVMCRMSF